MSNGDVAQLEQMLAELQVPDTAVIKQTEEKLRSVLKNPASLQALFVVLTTSQNVFNRHIAAVVMRMRIKGHWQKNLDDTMRGQFKEGVLSMLGNEPERTVRNSISRVIGVVARLEMEENNRDWPELFNVISTCAGAADNEAQRECAYVLLKELATEVGEKLAPHHQTLLNMFQAGLQDSSARVRTAAMSSASTLMCYYCVDSTEENAMHYAPLVPLLLQVAAHCLQSGDESSVGDVLEVFIELVSVPVPIVNSSINVLVEFLLDIMRSSALELSTRDKASLVVNSICKWKPKLLGRSGLVPKIIEVIAWLIATSEGSAAGALFMQDRLYGEEAEEDEDAATHQTMAQSTLDELALRVPQMYVLDPIKGAIQQLLNSPDTGSRKAGLSILAVVAEGCQEHLRTQLEFLVPAVINALADASADKVIKECACFALGQMSEHLAPEIHNYHRQILPVMLNTLTDERQTVQGTSCYVLEQFCEHLQPADIQPFLEPFMQRLMHLVKTGSPVVKEMSLSAIATTAVAAEKLYEPYLQTTAEVVMQFMNITQDELMSLRGKALETLGQISVAVGPEIFNPFLPPCMQACQQNLNLDNTELAEYTFCFLANLAKAFGPHFAHFVPDIVPTLCIAVDEAGRSAVDFSAVEEEYSALADEEDDEDGQVELKVHTAVVDMQKAGILALSSTCRYTEGACVQFAEELLRCAEHCFQAFLANIRCAAAELCSSIVFCTTVGFKPARKWRQGEHVNGDYAIHQATREVVQVCVAMYMAVIQEDTEVESCAAAVRMLKDIVDMCGPYVLVNAEAPTTINEEIMQSVLMLLKGQTPSQIMAADLDEGPSAEDEETPDAVLMDAVADLLASVTEALGPSIAPYLNVMLPEIIKYTDASKPYTMRSSAVGCLGEILGSIGQEGCMGYAETLLGTFLAGLRDPSKPVRRNAAFALGKLVEGVAGGKPGAGCGPLEAHFSVIAQTLQPVLGERQQPDCDHFIVDNAASALARMITMAPRALPVGDVLDSVLLPSLPIVRDTEECLPSYTPLCLFLIEQHPDLMNVERCAKCLSILAQALVDSACTPDDVKAQLANNLKEILRKTPVAQQSAQTLPGELQQILAAACQ